MRCLIGKSLLSLKYPAINHGFTLLEVMISISIIAITLTTLFGAQSQSLSLTAEMRFNNVASLLSRQKIAEFQVGQLEFISDSGDFGEEFPGYDWETVVEQAELEMFDEYETPEHPLFRVELTVSWNENEFSYLTVFYGREQDENAE